jgi:hypothetical protein
MILCALWNRPVFRLEAATDLDVSASSHEPDEFRPWRLRRLDGCKADRRAERQLIELHVAQGAHREDIILAVFRRNRPDLPVVDESRDFAVHRLVSVDEALDSKAHTNMNSNPPAFSVENVARSRAGSSFADRRSHTETK